MLSVKNKHIILIFILSLIMSIFAGLMVYGNVLGGTGELLGGTGDSSSTIIYVDPITGDDNNNGVSINSPKKTINGALKIIKDKNTINLAAGVYKGAGNTNLTISKDITITGAILNKNNINSQSASIIDGESNSWIFHIDSDECQIKNIVFKNGHTKLNGGAIYIKEPINIEKCIFTGNSASEDGGAIYSGEATINIKNTLFTNNTATGNGGAIYTIGDGNPKIINKTVFKGNNANQGGGIYNTGNLELQSCYFKDNAAPNYSSGGVYHHDKPLNIKQCAFINNTCGLYSESDRVTTITNSIFENNTYGAIRLEDSPLNVTSCQFLRNKGSYGSAIFTQTNSNLINIENTDFNNNQASNSGTICTDGNYDKGEDHKDVLKIIESRFINNTANNEVGISSDGIISLDRCTFINNTNKQPNTYFISAYKGFMHNSAIIGGTNPIIRCGSSFNATLNYWGLRNPNTIFTNSISVTYNPWLVLNISPSSTESILHGITLITVSINTDNNGQKYKNACPINLPIVFQTMWGSFSSNTRKQKIETILNKGEYVQAFYADDTRKIIENPVKIKITILGETKETLINIKQ